MTFNEDYSRVRRDNGAQNLAVMRHTALNLIRQEKATKGSIKTKRKLYLFSEFGRVELAT